MHKVLLGFQNVCSSSVEQIIESKPITINKRQLTMSDTILLTLHTCLLHIQVKSIRLTSKLLVCFPVFVPHSIGTDGDTNKT